MKNVNTEKITREQARLEDFGKVVILQHQQTIKVFRVRVGHAVGYCVEGLNAIHATPEEAITAAKTELGNQKNDRISKAVYTVSKAGRRVLCNSLGYLGFGLSAANEFAHYATTFKRNIIK